tara:strand:- start:168 stop:356 length:189 start_codon:yes stop_codon:yes gene_type:complete
MKKTSKKIESTVTCKATASLQAEVVDELYAQDGNLEEILEKAKNDNKCGKDSCECSKEDGRD